MSVSDLPSGRYLTCTVDVSPDYGGQTRALLMRNRIFAAAAGLRPSVLTFGAAPDYDDRRRILLERGLLVPEIALLNIYEHYREADWPAEDAPQTSGAEDLGDHVVREESMPDGSPWRRTILAPDAGSPVYEYLRADGTPYLRIPHFTFKDAASWPRAIEKVSSAGAVVGTFGSLGEWFRSWIRELTEGDERSFVFMDSRYVVPHVVPMRAPHIHLIYLLHNIHVSQPRRWDSPLNDTYQRVMDAVPDLDAMVTLTDRQREDIAQRRGSTDNLFVVPNPVDMPTSPPDLVRDPHRVAVVARIEPQKRLAHAIKGFAGVLFEHPKAHLDIYGSGGRLDHLEGLVREEGLESSVTLHGHDPQAREALWRSSAFLLTSSFEGYPLSTLESLSHGCPVVAYDIKYGPREQITDGEDGFLVPDGDLDQLAERVSRLLGSPELVESMSRAAVEKARQHGADRFVRDWAAVVDAVVRQKPLRTRLADAQHEVTGVEVRPARMARRALAHRTRRRHTALGRYGPDDRLRLTGRVRVSVRGPGRDHAEPELSVAAVFQESGGVVDLPVTWTRDGNDAYLFVVESPMRVLSDGRNDPARPDEPAGTAPEHARLRLRVVLANSVYEAWLAGPPATPATHAVAYNEDGLLVLTCPRPAPTAHDRP